MTQISIEEFYKNHKIDDDFDGEFYSVEYPETKNFYQPHCKENNIDDRHRLFYHWYFYGKKDYQKNYKKLYFKPDEKFLDVDVSVVLGCKNREKMLNISIHSWIKYNPIKEIIITDWSSDNNLKYLEKISPKIKVIRIEGKKYYNASTPVNIAIKEARCPLIMKLDVDYIINPYGNFNDLINVSKNEFLCGDWRDGGIDNNLGFVRGTNGFLCVHKENIEKVGYYDESIENYGYEDDIMFLSLIKQGLKRKTLKFLKHNIPIYHNPHSTYYRTKEFEQKRVSYNDKYYKPLPVIGPNFIIAGFQKCGTSALNENLCYNFPLNIYMPETKDKYTGKNTFELNYFTKWNRKDIDWYRSLFVNECENKICGEKAPNYTIHSGYSASEISKHYPDVKLIFLLRNPITRAYSAYNHFTQMLPHSKDFNWCPEKNFIENIFDEEKQAYVEKCSFLRNGLYARHIKDYLKYFDKSQMLFIVQERILSEKTSDIEWDRIISFLGLPQTKVNNRKIHNREYREPICKKSKVLLQDYFKEHNDELFEMLGYPIAEWQNNE